MSASNSLSATCCELPLPSAWLTPTRVASWIALALGVGLATVATLGVDPWRIAVTTDLDVAAPCNGEGTVDLAYSSPGGRIGIVEVQLENAACTGQTGVMQLARDPEGLQPIGVPASAVFRASPELGPVAVFDFTAQGIPAGAVGLLAAVVYPEPAP